MLFEVKNLSFKYNNGEKILKNINMQINNGERVGVIAKSGFGKSTLAKVLSGYLKPNKGEILLNELEVPQNGFSPVQLIYQHPEKSVNPNWKMRDILKEAGKIDGNLLEKMGIKNDLLKRYPRELSGGELQRFCIARALKPGTKLLIADEITTMLDVITQAQIWEVILDYASRNDLAIIVITHNVELAKRVCTRIINLEEENN